MALNLTLNGQPRTFEDLGVKASLAELVESLGLHADRVALELNGKIVSRARWGETSVHSGDKLELVHFVGGGGPSLC